MTSAMAQPRAPAAARMTQILWIALTVAVVAAAWRLPWPRVLEQLRHVRLSWLLAALLANLAILPLWAVEWRLLVPGSAKVGYRRMFEIVSVTASILNSVPFFAGEVSAVALLVTRGGLARAAALAVLAMDQLFVGLAKLATLAAVALAAPLPSWLRAGILSLALGVSVLLIGLLALSRHGESVGARLRSRPTQGRLLAAHLASWGSQFDALRQLTRFWRVTFLALAKKGAELLAIIAVQLAFGLDPTFSGALLVLAALAITTLLPVAPANLGVYEATVFAAYRYLGVPVETAVGLAIVQHVCFLVPAIATGYVGVTTRQLSRLARAS